MIQEGSGSIFDADVDALVNPVNSVGVAGKGLALEFKRAFPGNFAAYQAACKYGKIQPGGLFIADPGLLTPRLWIINFPTKRHWRDASRLEDIDSGLRSLVAEVQARGIKSIAIPVLGCGEGKLLWADVRPMIEAAAREMPGVRVVVFPPQ